MKKYIILSGALFISGAAFSQVGINTENPQGIFNVDGGKNNSSTGIPTADQQKDDFVILSDGSVGIGTTKPNASSILDLDVTAKADGEKKGFLAPRVELDSRTDQTTIPSPAVGLLVYNIPTTDGLKTEGYHYWNGTEWRSISSNTSIDPQIQTLNCSDARFNPPQFTAGQPYSGVMIVPYSGGNGGSYGAGTPIASTGNIGLTATLRSGTLTNGEGELIYDLTGIPSQSSPNAANFPITVLDQSCTVSLKGDLLQVGETYGYLGDILMMSMGSNQYASEFLSDLPTIEGIRLDLRKINGGFTYQPYIYNTTSTPIDVQWQNLYTSSGGSTVTGKLTLAAGANTNLNGSSSNSSGWNPSTAQVATINIIIGGNRWYKVEYYCISDTQTTPVNGEKHHVRISITRLQ